MKIKRKKSKTHQSMQQLYGALASQGLSEMNMLVMAIANLKEEASSRSLNFLLGNFSGTKRRVEYVKQSLQSSAGSFQKEHFSSVGFQREWFALLERTSKGPVRDAAMIAWLQKILHSHMASCRMLSILAKVLEKAEEKELFEGFVAQALDADSQLSDAADNTINFDAALDENRNLVREHYNPNL
ncbi:protein of unknown function [Flavobacterium anhuiense]|uniref:DUF892 domain containing protein n=1 Tax=Flavobacterium anhuiense TaxID=459526 RepID=A0ABY0LPB9_9FLAO|nr:DUF892 family protein [Flavobacterium anhuiense]SCY46086.1 protein of unknown function [Flavobacterium anhuiense]